MEKAKQIQLGYGVRGNRSHIRCKYNYKLSLYFVLLPGLSWNHSGLFWLASPFASWINSSPKLSFSYIFTQAELAATPFVVDTFTFFQLVS